MKSPVYLLLLLLVLSPAFAYAASQTISVETDSSSYEKGSVITISGLITNYDESDPNAVNTEGASWKLNGDYTVTVNYAAQTASTTFAFIIPEAAAAEAAAAEAAAAEAAAAEKCGEGTHLEDGACVLDETVSTESTPESPSMSSAQTVSTWIYSITFPVLIALVIAIFLYLISRASRRKTT